VYPGVASVGVSRFAAEGVRSNNVITTMYPSGVDDGEFRRKLSERYDVVIAGGFGKMKGRLFRIGCMGQVSESDVNRTMSALAITLAESGPSSVIRVSELSRTLTS